MSEQAPKVVVTDHEPHHDYVDGNEIDTGEWSNWGGNQSFRFEKFAEPTDESAVVSAVRDSADRGQGIRVAGSGHSFTPIVETDHTLLSLESLSGVIATDPDRLRATVRSGTRLSDIGAPLWESGLSLANQGDIDAQSLAGAVATGTKGSGPSYGSLSSMVRSMRLVNGRGGITHIAETDPDRLHAAQVSLGLLGVVLDLEIETLPAYKLRENNAVLPFDEVSRDWDQYLADYRHFSFWWMPTPASSAMYDLGSIPQDHCVVKLLEQLPADAPDVEADPGQRTGRAHLIYPDATTEARFHELEYMVPAERGIEALDVVRHVMQQRYPDQISPVQVRWQKADEAFLSAHYERDTMSISVSGQVGTVYEPFLRELDRELQVFDARPHWGKLHYLTRDRVEALYPRYEDFQSIRRELDPDGVFLNPHLRELFG
ncbi:D-arabinono-1,4-lactone oxidase [Rhodococcus sp. 06-156-3C]|uniref:D-arabinono-1,4-lactone oxidase n=1 Tax=Nocardiaceae TaxID=85025 RepID=UPI0009B8E873|nr:MULTISPECIES: D-arabinono-1,4-lactone oxidase [Rhodococcus]OZD18221.1 D-arabinono-1,4-lactone oxidase [Rhodococcus sp. 06-156-4C]OZD18819.1 D-arabinono-1,4-lactone oxidase [Rhodococcus sp. 06-156-3C]OZD22329.1 D-arabinono-1,4-lactone oxidase [Rhodococcus sp. 06-156-4a]OZD34135.1 D-arabinono-1,4-lactone oxidase [Rhodococcus sp. 06-156-3b]OZD38872.1 D-arabinono-1,4-lactone oxidase [Rhodococcus sp. 06-156-3]